MKKTEELVETWVPIKDFTNYAVSDQGRVMNVKLNRMVKGHDRSDGNTYITLEQGDRRRVVAVHVLVAEGFSLGYSNSRMRRRVTHKDGDKANNSLENLNYKTSSIMQRDIPPHVPVKKRYIEIVDTGMKFPTVFEVAEYLGVAVPSVYRCLNGHRPHISGVKLKYTWD